MRGTFTVPYLTTAAACEDTASEWVGIDGTESSDLIQAGVSETSENPATGECSSSQFYIFPWWEVLPASATPEYDVSVNAGDSVTVDIWEVTTVTWGITLTDNTNGESFSVTEPFQGPLNSAEWITEAYATSDCSDANLGGEDGAYICPLAPYNPPVQYSDIATSASSNVTMSAVVMAQYGQTVSEPSAYANGAFTTSYTGSSDGIISEPSSSESDLRQVAPAPRRPYLPSYEHHLFQA